MKRLPVLALVAAACSSGCSLANRIDTCDTPRDHDFQVNSTTSGDQYTYANASLARLASGLYAAAWISSADASVTQPNEVRAALFQSNGTIVPPCGTSSGDVRISVAADRRIAHVAVGVGPNTAGPLYIAWSSRAASDTSAFAPYEVSVRLMRQDMCTWNAPPLDQTVFTMSAPGENASAPVIAARQDGREALVAWYSLPTSPSGPFEIRVRPVGVTGDPFGAILQNGCDGMNAPCVVSTEAYGGPPSITRLGTGYALAWGESRIDGVLGDRMRVQTFDASGGFVASAFARRQFGNVLYVESAIVEVPHGLALAMAGKPRSGALVPDDDDVFLERFDRSLLPLGSVVRVNDQRTGSQGLPSIAALPADGLFVAWVSFGAGTSMAADVWGRAFDGANRPMFTGLSCDSTEFLLSTVAGSLRTSPCVVGAGEDVLAIWTDGTPAPGTSTDGLGRGIQGRRFDLHHLAPTVGDPTPGLSVGVPDAGTTDTCMHVSSGYAGPCGCDMDCPSGNLCTPETTEGSPSGICAGACDPSLTPPAGAVCVGFGPGIGMLREACSSSEPCRAGWACAGDTSSGPFYCRALCSSDAQCTSTMHCDLYEGICTANLPSSLSGLNGPCTVDGDCRSDYCYVSSSGPTPNYCLSFCNLLDPVCPEGADCLAIFSSPNDARGQCYFDCVGGIGGTCPTGWVCSTQGHCIESP